MCILRGAFHRQIRHKGRAFERNFGPGAREFERSNLQTSIFRCGGGGWGGGDVAFSTRSVHKKYKARGLSTQCCDKSILLQRRKAAVLLHSTAFPVTKTLREK